MNMLITFIINMIEIHIMSATSVSRSGIIIISICIFMNIAIIMINCYVLMCKVSYAETTWLSHTFWVEHRCIASQSWVTAMWLRRFIDICIKLVFLLTLYIIIHRYPSLTKKCDVVLSAAICASRTSDDDTVCDIERRHGCLTLSPDVFFHDNE